MDFNQIVVLAVPIAAVGAALVAVVICMVFFLAASKSRQDSRQAAQAISSNVDRLEKLFDKIFNETFAVMREVVSYSLNHRNSDRKEKEGQETVTDLKSAAALMAGIEDQLKDLEQALSQLVDHQKAIAEVIRPGAGTETGAAPAAQSDAAPRPDSRETADSPKRRLRIDLLEHLSEWKDRGTPLRASDVFDALEKRGHQPPDVVRELERLEKEGLISLSDELPMGSNTIIRITE